VLRFPEIRHGDRRCADFRLPTLGPVLDRLRAEVLDGRGFVLLRGMPVEDWPIAESATAYWRIGTYFGSARSQNAQGSFNALPRPAIHRGTSRAVVSCGGGFPADHAAKTRNSQS
jgi:hypothetical protein